MFANWFRSEGYSLVPTITRSGKTYNVRAEGDDKTARAELLETVDNLAKRLISELAVKHPDKCYTPLLLERYGKIQIYEADPNSDLTAYTTEKTSIALCLRRIKGDHLSELVDVNILMYVLVHELGHLGINHVGHGTEFWDAFKELSAVAYSIGVLQYTDYSKAPTKYCAMAITSNIKDSVGGGTNFSV